MPASAWDVVAGDQVELDLGPAGAQASHSVDERAAALAGEVASDEEDPDRCVVVGRRGRIGLALPIGRSRRPAG